MAEAEDLRTRQSSRPTDRSGNEEEKFRIFLADFSNQYLGNKYQWLRFLLYEPLPISVLSMKDINGKFLFNELASRGHISPTNVTILSCISEVTEMVSAKQCVEAYEQETQCKKGKGLKPFRKEVFKGLMEVTNAEVDQLKTHYSLSCLTFTNVWDLVFHLEFQKYLDKRKNWEEFASYLNKTAQDKIIDSLKWHPAELKQTEGNNQTNEENKTESPIAKDTFMNEQSLCNLPESTHQNITTEGTSLKLDADAIQDVITKLNLQEFYPGKLTRERALEVSSNTMSLDTELSNATIPMFMLQSLLMCNYTGRFLVAQSSPKETFDWLDFISCSTNVMPKQVSPADTLVALFLCSDNFLRQLLVEKLSICQLAIPLLLPYDGTDRCSCEMLVWAMSTVSKKWTNSENVTFEKSMVVHQLPIVSAFRLGKCRLSKSRVLNHLVFNYNKHDMFFDYESKGGTIERKISNGLVELGWYLPRGKCDDFSKPVTILNLRGNASNLKKQTSFLSEISQVIIGFTSSGTFEEEDAVLLESFFLQNGHLILVFDGQPNQQLLESIKQLHKRYPQKQIKFISGSHMNTFDISRRIWANLSTLIDKDKHLVPDRSIEECADIAERHNFCVDERRTDCLQAKNHASYMMNRIKHKAKQQYLPLQVTAVEIGNTKKEMYRQKCRENISTEMYLDKMQRIVYTLRRKQKESYGLSSKIFKEYETSLMLPILMRKYFNRYVKILTERNSFDTLQPVRNMYMKAWNKLCEFQRIKDQQIDRDRFKSVLKSMKKELDDLELRIADLSLGIEHFNREIGQVYEMTSYFKLFDAAPRQLPDIVAELLLDGHPLELMDGDASYVPLSWIEAVFDSLKRQIGDKYLFILSVIGVQSSGKSTMLNTMFGLQFAVKAGRCTKGIFANLVKLDSATQQKTHYDYILVVDTEGLRSTELASIERNNDHDNELVTLSVGIGDVTIINIMGENVTEMQETLQIAVHAFMKMDIVNIKPSCIFVHQNVTDSAAFELNSVQKRKLVNVLDEATRFAAEEENCSFRYQRFSDVIQFHENKDVMYVSSLWQGNPPTAPTNPGYSESIVKIKQKIIEFMRWTHVRSITEFISRLSDVWNAILCEDFIFSFRNEIEIVAYNLLEMKYLKSSRVIRNKALKYITRLQEECMKLTTEELDAVRTKLLKGKLDKVDEDMKILQKEMEDYFTKEKNACPWKHRVAIMMKSLSDEIRAEITEAFKIVCLTSTKVHKHEANILIKAKQLVNKFHHTTFADVQLKEVFDKEWAKWLSEIEPIYDLHAVEWVELEKVVRESYKLYDSASITVIFQSGLGNNDIVNDEDILISKFTYVKDMNRAVSDHNYRTDKARCIAQKIRQDLAVQIYDYGKNGNTYCHSLGLKVFKQIQDELKENADKCNFKQGKCILIAVRILFSLLPEFKKLHEHAIHAQLENQKEKLWINFKNECKTENIVSKIASSITDELERAIKISLSQHCISRMIQHMVRIETFANKMSFHAHTLIDLAEMRSFIVYLPYLIDPFKFMKRRIQQHVKNEACSKDMANGNSVLENIYLEKLQDMFRKIKRAVDATCQNKGKENLNMWWTEFFKFISNELVVSNQLICLNEYGGFDVQDLKVKLQMELESSKEKLKKAFETIVKVDKIVDQCQQFFEKDLFGCQELCPFCKAPCDLQTMNDKHRTAYHRPLGVSGYLDTEKKKLAVSICTTNVSSCETFICEDTKWQTHPYKNYQGVNDYYKAWKIQPRIEEPQLYWKWFMKTFNKELAEYYEVEPADIPKGWNEISWESAKEDMMKTYNLCLY